MPKTNPNYPVLNTSGPETPIGVIVRRVDPDFDKARRFDLAYDFRKHRFFVDSVIGGSYAPESFGFSGGFSTGFETLGSQIMNANGFGP